MDGSSFVFALLVSFVCYFFLAFLFFFFYLCLGKED